MKPQQTGYLRWAPPGLVLERCEKRLTVPANGRCRPEVPVPQHVRRRPSVVRSRRPPTACATPCRHSCPPFSTRPPGCTMKSIEPAPDPTYAQLRAVIWALHNDAESQSLALHKILHDEFGGLIVAAAMDLGSLIAELSGNGPFEQRLRRAHLAM